MRSSTASPLIGMVTERHFSSEKVLAVLNLLTAFFLLLAANVTSPTLLLAVVILSMLCYMASWSLTTSISMVHTCAEQFPRIGVFGSIGWVASPVFRLVAISVFKVKF